MAEVDQWLVFGLDPSLSRTGYALMHVYPTCYEAGDSFVSCTGMKWLSVGSVKPEETSNPEWLRSKGIALYLREHLEEVADRVLASGCKNLGLIISTEFPTPMNDWLVPLNRIMHVVFFETELWQKFATVRVLTTNASTLRSVMNLTQRGASNKKENIARAYEYIDINKFPSLDTDSCDAVLLAIMAEYASSIFLGNSSEVPPKFLKTLCDATQEMKGSGTRAKIQTKGLLHRKAYWYSYAKANYSFVIKDATSTSKKLPRKEYHI